MVGSQVEIGGRDCSHSPFCLTGKGVPLIVAGCGGNDFISMFVNRPGGCGRNLALLFGLLLVA